MLPLIITGLALAQSDAIDRVPQDFPTIQAAVDRGSAPVIQVAPGTWEGAMVDRGVAIIGSPGAVIDRGVRVRSGVRAAFGLLDGADGTEITGFVVDCRSRRLDLGVYGSVPQLGGAADHVVVSRNTFLQCVQGVTNAGSPVRDCETEVDGGAYWVVQGNVFDGFGTTADSGRRGGGIGVVLFNVHAADVLSNTFRGHVEDTPVFSTTGVSLAGCMDCTVGANHFSVQGGRYTWTSVANLGYAQAGGAPSSGVILSGNDASADSAPFLGVNFRSLDSQDVEIYDNRGTALVDHAFCGDGRIEVIE